MLRRTLSGTPLVTKQRTFSSDERNKLDDNVNAFLEQLSDNGRVTGFELSHSTAMAAAASYGLIRKEYTTTIVWQEYAE